MFLLTAIIMTIFCAICAGFTTFATYCSDQAKLRRTKKEMEWAQTHEDKWLPNTTTIVREGGSLRFYPKNRQAVQKYGSGRKVYYGINKYNTEYGIICNGDVVFGYRDFIESSVSAERFQYKDGKRLLYMGERLFWKRDSFSYEKVYKVENTNEYYIIYNNKYRQVTHQKGDYWK